MLAFVIPVGGDFSFYFPKEGSCWGYLLWIREGQCLAVQWPQHAELSQAISKELVEIQDTYLTRGSGDSNRIGISFKGKIGAGPWSQSSHF